MFIKLFVNTIFFIYCPRNPICTLPKSDENENDPNYRLQSDQPDLLLCLEKICRTI